MKVKGKSIKFFSILQNKRFDFKSLKRIYRKLRDMLIPFNSHYKPQKVYYSSRLYAQLWDDESLECHEIYSDYVSKVRLPQILFDSLSPHHIHDDLDPEQERSFVIKETYILAALSHGRVYSNNLDTIAYITKDNCLLDDISYQWKPYEENFGEWKNKVLFKKFFHKPKKYKGTVFSMIAGSSAVWNYSHWLLDALSRVHLLQKAGLFDSVDYFLVPSFQMDFQKDSLRMLGIKDEQIIEATEETHIEADLLLATSHPRSKSSYIIPQWMIDFYRTAFTKNDPSTNKYPEFIYISRKDAKYRYVENEEALIKLLKSYGFSSYVLTSLPFAEKIKLFASAKAIISLSGAALTNYVFCKESAKVIEIFPQGLVHSIFCDIAQKTGLEYQPVIVKNGSTAQTQKEGILENVTVDLNEMKKLLNSFVFSHVTDFISK